MKSELTGKTAIVTGSTRGIGFAIAESLVKAGANVIINGTTQEGVQKAVEQLTGLAGKVIGYVGRVEQMETGKELVELALQEFHGIDYLINNAGDVADKMSHRMTEEDWDFILAVHAKGTFSCTKPFLNALKQTGNQGVIINMTSLAGLIGTVGQLNYAAAKGAILAMTYTLAEEWKASGIRVYAVSPAALTDMTRPHVERAEQKAKERGEELPDYWRIGSSEEVADLVQWLLINEVETGTVWGVNGKRVGEWTKPQYQERNNIVGTNKKSSPTN